MCPVDKEICLEILRRGLRTHQALPSFRGPAENFEKFNDPNFQRFAKENGISPQTQIKVWEKGADAFGVSVQ